MSALSSHFMRFAGMGLVALGMTATASDALAWRAVEGPRGGGYVAGPRGVVAEGPRGGVAATGFYGPGYGRGYPVAPLYPAYRPPVAVYRPVPVYPGYGYPAAGLAVAGAAVAGAAIGAAAASPSYYPVPPPPVVAPGMPIGTAYSSLPSGCVTQSRAGGTIFRCGGAWLQPRMQGTNVIYVVVPGP